MDANIPPATLLYLNSVMLRKKLKILETNLGYSFSTIDKETIEQICEVMENFTQALREYTKFYIRE